MSLASMRCGLADVLASATGLTVHSSVPQVMSPPCIVLRPAEPWVASGGTYGEWLVSYVLTLYVKYQDYGRVTEEIEDALPPVLDALGDDWSLNSIGEPYVAEIGEMNVPAVDLTVAHFTDDL